MLVWLIAVTDPAWPQTKLEKIKSEYQVASAELQKHIVDTWWIDDDPRSPELLARQWSLAGEWVAAWLDAHPTAEARSIEAAISELAPTEDAGDSSREFLSLGRDTFLVTAPGAIGNVFIVTKSNGHYHLAWSTAQAQEASGEQAEILAAWRAENAREGDRGPYWAASGPAGSVMPHVETLPEDAKGHARFYIDGMYAQSAGGTVGNQISLWLWDGKTAHLLIARAYTFMIDQSVGTRLEGDLLKVQQKKFFRTFFSCGGCEERQTDWIVRITPEGIEDLGEVSRVPDLDAVDELFYRLMKHKSATDLAAPAAIQSARKILEEDQAEHSEKEWKKFPTLGMMGEWNIKEGPESKVLCFSADDVGSILFTLKSVDGGLFITHVTETEQSCAK
ncbi:MAG: hypothetical protein ABSG70_14980 [Terriglobales bacterium]